MGRREKRAEGGADLRGLPGRLCGAAAKLFAAALILGFAAAAYGWHGLQAQSGFPGPEVRNPTEIRTALGFGLLYAVVLFSAAGLVLAQ